MTGKNTAPTVMPNMVANIFEGVGTFYAMANESRGGEGSTDADGDALPISASSMITGCGPGGLSGHNRYGDGETLDVDELTSPLACSTNSERSYGGDLMRVQSVNYSFHGWGASTSVFANGHVWVGRGGDSGIFSARSHTGFPERDFMARAILIVEP